MTRSQVKKSHRPSNHGLLWPILAALVGCSAGQSPDTNAEAAPQPAESTDPSRAITDGDPLFEALERARREFSGGFGEPLPEFTAKCEIATGVPLRDFKCSEGTEVPISHFSGGSYPQGQCDRPNRLNRACDPGSRFQVLNSTSDAVAVAHCRKTGLPGNLYSDIAIIQYNKVNGATCFYQALSGSGMDGDFKSPGRGTSSASDADMPNPAASPWLSNAATKSIDCRRCHDNGAIIRSPYLAQLASGTNALPGASDFTYNKTNPVSFIGTDYQDWHLYSVQVSDSVCNNCHRMGVSNTPSPGAGTARDFGIRATATSETSKNPHSAASPIWMMPNQITFNAQTASAASQIKSCADAFAAGSALPSGCTVPEITSPFTGLTPAIIASAIF